LAAVRRAVPIRRPSSPGSLHAAAAAREGVAVAGLTVFRLSPGSRGGLIFGYSDLNERKIAEGVMRLARAVSSLREACVGSHLS
jgi:DNA-binding transcriptional MocR family regulator